MRVPVTAIEPFNNHRPGERFELPEREAEQAIKKGLVAVVGAGSSKVAAPSGDPHSPSADGGKGQSSSASPAAPASSRRTARRSGGGGSRRASKTAAAKPPAE